MKKNILFMIIGIIIATGIGVVATSVLRADTVYYNENITVKDKIDDLYDKADNLPVLHNFSLSRGTIIITNPHKALSMPYTARYLTNTYPFLFYLYGSNDMENYELITKVEYNSGSYEWRNASGTVEVSTEDLEGYKYLKFELSDNGTITVDLD